MPVPIAELFVSVGADVSGALTGLAAVGTELTTMGSKFNDAKAGAALLTAAGASVGLAFGKAATDAADFETLLVQTRNNTTQTDADMQQMNDTILKLGATSPVPLEQLAEGFMHVSNFGFDAAASTEILDAAMRSATSTGGNTAQTAEVLAAVMKEFGISGDQASKTMDQLHIASAEGNTTLEQYSQSFGQVAAFSAAVGVPLDQAAAAMAAMTRHGFDAATAATQVKDQIVHLINPSAAAEKVIKDLSKTSGVDLVSAFSATGVHTLGLKGVMDLTTTAMNKVGLSADQQTAEWLKLVPNIRGGAASFVLAGRGAQDFNDILHDIDTSTGVTDDAFQRIQGTLNFQWGVITNDFQEMAITIGNLLKPALVDVLSHISDFLASVRELPPDVLRGIVTLTGFAGATALLVGGFVLLAPLAAAIGPAIGAIGGIIVGLLPWALALGAAFFGLKAAWDRDLGGIQEIGAKFNNLRDIIEAALSGDISGAWAGLVEDIKTVNPAFRSVIDSVEEFLGHFSNMGDIIQATLAGEVAAAWGGFLEDVKTLNPAIREVIDNIGDFLGHALDLAGALGDFLGKSFNDLIGAIDPLIPKFLELGGAISTTVITAVGDFFSRLGTDMLAITQAASSGQGIGGFFENLGTALQNFGGVLEPLQPLFGSFGGLVGAIFNFVGSLVQLQLVLAQDVFGLLVIGLQKLADQFTLTPAIQAFAIAIQGLGEAHVVIDFLADAINKLALGIQFLTQVASGNIPPWLQDILNNPGAAVGGVLGGAGNAAGGVVAPVVPGQNGAPATTGPLAPGSPLVNVGQLIISSEAEGQAFLARMADAIATATNRVNPPPDNSGFPALQQPAGVTP